MNLVHRWLCNSALWQARVEERIIPWALAELELGKKVLEIGPGPGITTDVLRQRIVDLTCVEIECTYAASLARRMAGKNVTVLCGDGAAVPLANDSFDGVLCFTMLHHLSSAELQDRLLAEAARVLRPGGIFAGVDSRSSRLFRLLHIGDAMLTVNPQTFPDRLEAAGFANIQVDLNKHGFRFRAWKP